MLPQTVLKLNPLVGVVIWDYDSQLNKSALRGLAEYKILMQCASSF